MGQFCIMLHKQRVPALSEQSAKTAKFCLAVYRTSPLYLLLTPCTGVHEHFQDDKDSH